MALLRTMRGFIRALAMAFVIAQFAGVVSSPLAHAHAGPAMTTAQADHGHANDALVDHAHLDHARGLTHNHQGCPHQDHGRCGDRADYCCALHAFFAGVLPPAVAIDAVSFIRQRLTLQPTAAVGGVAPSRLDRPPRPLL
jgi:hypothetical protein